MGQQCLLLHVVMLQVLTYLNCSLHQNKLLHSRLEAKHLNSAEKDSHSGKISSGSTGSDQLEDSGLQSVVNYLRRTKEIVREFFVVLLFLSFCSFSIRWGYLSHVLLL